MMCRHVAASASIFFLPNPRIWIACCIMSILSFTLGADVWPKLPFLCTGLISPAKIRHPSSPGVAWLQRDTTTPTCWPVARRRHSVRANPRSKIVRTKPYLIHNVAAKLLAGSFPNGNPSHRIGGGPATEGRSWGVADRHTPVLRPCDDGAARRPPAAYKQYNGFLSRGCGGSKKVFKSKMIFFHRDFS